MQYHFECAKLLIVPDIYSSPYDSSQQTTGENCTTGTLKALRVSLVKPVAYLRVGSYVRFFGLKLKKVELYTGESAVLWSGDRFPMVVNIVTSRDESTDESKAEFEKEVTRGGSSRFIRARISLGLCMSTAI